MFVITEPDDGSNVRRARAYVAERLDAAGLVSLSDDAQLVATELLTNALLHAGPPVSVVVRVAGSSVDIVVHDPSRVAPARPWFAADAMTGRGLQLVEGLATDWGVRLTDDGKVVWAELSADGVQADGHEHASWVVELGRTDPNNTGELADVRLEGVPTLLLLHAQAHVDNLLREFMLAGLDRPGVDDTAFVPPTLAYSVRELVEGFTAVREQTRRVAHAAMAADETHFDVDLRVSKEASDAGAALLNVLERLDAYCRAERMLTLESPPQHCVFRDWFICEIVQQVEEAHGRRPVQPRQSFEDRLLEQIGAMAEIERKKDRVARLFAVTSALAAAASSREVAHAVLNEGVFVLGADGGGILVAEDDGLEVPATVGYEPIVVALLESEDHSAELPAAQAIRTGQAVWLESPRERDERFPALAELEGGSASLCAVPLKVRGRCLGALRFSFKQGRLFDSDERAFVQALADQTALALDRTLAQERAERAEEAERAESDEGR